MSDKKKKRKSLPFAIVGSILGIVISLSLVVFFFFFYYSGKIYPGISIARVKLGGASVSEAEQLIQNEIQKKFPDALHVTYKDRVWTIETASISAKPDYNKSAQEAFNYGRKGSVLGNVQAITDAFVHTYTIPLDVSWDEASLSAVITSIDNELSIPKEEAAIVLTKKNGSKLTIEVTPGRDGRRVIVTKLRDDIETYLQTIRSGPLTIPIEELPVKTTPEELDKAKKRATELLSKQLTLTASDTKITLSGEELIPFISVKNDFDLTKIASYAGTIATDVNRPPQDALFQFSSGKVESFHPSKNGLTLDQNVAIEKISSTLSELEATDSATLSIELPVKETQPAVNTGQANNLGIKELIGKGESYYFGSSNERIHNLTLLTTKLNGVLIPPGETFSMAKAAGDISAATGYKQAYVIQNGRTVLGDGGGSCQPSTTLFRAAINSGLPIEERTAHAYRVHYYEEGGWAPGFDATIFLPTVDLKFKNDTPSYILIQSYITPAEMKLTFELYGVKDGREIYISRARMWDQQPAPPPLYQDDPTIPKGVVKQVDFAAGGLKTSFDYKVTKNGQIIQEKTFYSNFRPWQAVFLKGTKE